MKNFGLIFQYEIKKITHRKLWLIAFAAILLFTILIISILFLISLLDGVALKC